MFHPPGTKVANRDGRYAYETMGNPNRISQKHLCEDLPSTVYLPHRPDLTISSCFFGGAGYGLIIRQPSAILFLRYFVVQPRILLSFHNRRCRLPNCREDENRLPQHDKQSTPALVCRNRTTKLLPAVLNFSSSPESVGMGPWTCEHTLADKNRNSLPTAGFRVTGQKRTRGGREPSSLSMTRRNCPLGALWERSLFASLDLDRRFQNLLSTRRGRKSCQLRALTSADLFRHVGPSKYL
ncbi:hypothetical protein ACLOJK_001166 [Asimina triloba]